MVHLKLETLARLVDEPPSDDERAHLAGCVRCQAELETMTEQTRDLSALPPFQPPEGEWARLEARLGSERMSALVPVEHAPARIEIGASPRSDEWMGPSSRAWLRAAAAVLLFTTGAAGGWVVRGTGPEVAASTGSAASTGAVESVRPGSSGPDVARPEAAAGTELTGGSASGTDLTGGGASGTEPASGSVSSAALGSTAPSAQRDVSRAPAETRPAAAAPTGPRSTAGPEPPARALADAAELVRAAEDLYIGALLVYGQQLESTGGAPMADPVGRYMALGNVLAVTRDAVRSAPADPFLNGLMINTIAEQEATLHRISLAGSPPDGSMRGAP